MKIVIKDNYQELSEKAALLIKEAILNNPKLVLGLATGSTPLGTYKRLIEMYQEGEISFAEVTIFNLDEYFGLAPDHPQSYNYFMKHNLLSKIDINYDNFYIPDGLTDDPDKSSLEYEEKIKKFNGIDLQILGIGSDGHIGFNEPGTSFSSRTHLANLASSTIKDNSRFFENEREVPSQAMTMGIATILEAKEILLLASGINKSEICAKLIDASKDIMLPASALKEHDNVTILLDKEAASQIKT